MPDVHRHAIHAMAGSGDLGVPGAVAEIVVLLVFRTGDRLVMGKIAR